MQGRREQAADLLVGYAPCSVETQDRRFPHHVHRPGGEKQPPAPLLRPQTHGWTLQGPQHGWKAPWTAALQHQARRSAPHYGRETDPPGANSQEDGTSVVRGNPSGGMAAWMRDGTCVW